MRNTLIFAGSSIPELTTQICTNLGMAPAGVELSQFANVSSQQAYGGQYGHLLLTT
jgi:phosphoribosylpyrophosphate synthetase